MIESWQMARSIYVVLWKDHSTDTEENTNALPDSSYKVVECSINIGSLFSAGFNVFNLYNKWYNVDQLLEK